MTHVPDLFPAPTLGIGNLVRLLARASAICLPLLPASPGEAQREPPKPLLTLHFAITAPGFAMSHSWSANGKSIAILFAYGSLYLLNAEDGQLTGPIAQNIPGTQLALSGDTSLFSITSGREVRLYTMAPLTLLAQTTLPTPCASSPDRRDAIFTADATYLWVRCAQARSLLPEGSAVAQYRLPSLEMASTIPSKSLGPLQSINGRAVVMGFTIEAIATDPGTHRRVIHYSFECIKLDLQLPCFRSVPMRNTRLDPPLKAALSRSYSVLAVGSHTPTPGESRVDFYATSTGALMSSINISARLSLGLFQELTALDDSYFIGAFNSSKLPNSDVVRDGGIVVWRRETGEVQQDIRRGPVEMMSLSPDGRKLLVITRRELLIYVVSNR